MVIDGLAFAINLAHVGIGTIVSVLITFSLWLSRVIRNRQLGSIRNKLRILGIVERETIQALLEEGASENTGLLSEGVSRNPFIDVEIRNNVRDALVELVQESDLPDSGGFWPKCARPFLAVYRSLYPFLIRSEDRGTLEKYAPFINIPLDRMNPERRAGELIVSQKEKVRLERLVEIAPWGEIWQAFVDRAAGRPKSPEYRTVRFYTEEKICERIVADEKDLIRELDQLVDAKNIARSYYLGGVEDEKPYVVSEFIPGISLQRWLTDVGERPRLVRDEVIQNLIIGLAAAHEKGIFHCRLDPSKILLDVKRDTGKQPEVVGAKIADFCISRITEKRPHPLYAAPDTDAADDDDLQKLIPQHDMFALGVIWYQLLMDAELERPPYDFYTRLNDHPREIRDRVEKCLAHPDSRWKKAGDLLDDIEGNGNRGTTQITDPPTTNGFDVRDLLINYLKSLPRKSA